jgi:hypothetical protein
MRKKIKLGAVAHTYNPNCFRSGDKTIVQGLARVKKHKILSEKQLKQKELGVWL